jgi:Xaa-Pro aminopeptidase
MPDYKKRIMLLRERLSENEIDEAIIVGWDNIFYYTGMTSYQSSVNKMDAIMPIIINKDLSVIVTNGFTKSIKEDYPYIKNYYGFAEDKLIAPFVSKNELIKKVISSNSKRVGIDLCYCSVKNYLEFKNQLSVKEFVDVSDIIAQQRMIKDREEISSIKKAAEITDKIYDEMKTKYIHQGITERQAALKILELAAGFNCRIPFIQVFSGPRSCYQNITPGDRKFQKGDIVLLDYGVTVNGYNTDITRVICVGKVNSKQKEIFNIVKSIIQSTLDFIKPGIMTDDIERHVIELYTKFGVKEYYIHRTGHGLGITKGSEPPYINEVDSVILSPSMVLSIEPGIYDLNTATGIRLEDNIVITDSGIDNLTKCPYELFEIL